MTERPTRAVLDRPAAARAAAQRGPADQREAGPLPVAQRGPGNQAIQRRLLAPAIQRAALDPPIAAPEDEHEREAERVAALLTGGVELPEGAIGGAPAGIGRAAEDERKKKPEPGKPAPGKSVAAVPPAAGAPPGEPPKKADEAGPSAAVPEKKKKEDEPPIARAAETAASSGPAVTPAVRGGIGGGAGSGRPLEPAARSRFERGLGHDLSGVRIHDDAPAARAASDLRAQAFTYGQDVFFGAGRYQPGAPEGARLLAHELAHTVQQRPGAPLHRRAIQRNGQIPPPQPQPAPPAPGGAGGAAPAAAAPDATTFPPAVGTLDGTTVKFDKLPIPQFKAAAGGYRRALYDQHKPHRHRKAYDRGNPQQRAKWRTDVPGTQATVDALAAKPAPGSTSGAGGGAPATGAAEPYVFRAPPPRPGLPPRFVIGDLATAAKEMVLPSWDKGGAPHQFDVDHIVELQLADWDRNSGHWANQLDNMELLDSSANSSSGSGIARSIATRVRTFLTATEAIPKMPRSAEALKNRYHLEFGDVEAGDADPPVTANEAWRRSEIEAGDHAKVDAVTRVHPSEVGAAGEVKIFRGPAGGVPRTFTWAGGSGPVATTGEWEPKILEPFTTTHKQFDVAAGTANPAGPLGTLTIELKGDTEHWRPFGPTPITVPRIPGLPFAGYIDRTGVREALAGLGYKKASPIELEDEPDLLPQGGIGVRGRIMPEIEPLRGVGLDFELAGRDLRIFKEFHIEDVQVPRPFVVNDVSLVASAGTESGLQLTGQVDFEIERVGTGMLRAAAGTAHGIEFDGAFDFDSKLFDPARITIAYRDGQWSGTGDLGIPPGKVPGIRRGLFHASYSAGRLDATGTAETTIPGVSQAAVALSYSDAEGLAIGGQLTLAPTVPGLRGGTLQARVEQKPETGDYRVTARGEAQPAIPGVDATLTIDYDDGALTVQGSAAYSRGPMSGQLTLGATNRPVNPDGTIVAGGAPTETVTAYGGGQATIRLTPWLQGTAGLRILPNGQVELAGAIGLPSTVDVFPEKSYTRNILTIGFDIPIVGVAVAGARVGIFATIAGGLDFSAGVGPGQLQELGVQVTFNPDQPERTHIEGGAKLHIPAHAGLRLFVRGGIGAGIPLVSATAGLELGGALGLEAAVDASVHVDWMPDRGLVLDAAGEVSVEPRFRFDITGFVLVEAGAFGFTIELYSQRWQLAAVEYGSGLRLGMRFPIHYEEGQPFDVSWSDVEFEIPDVNPRELLSGLVAQIA